MFCKLMLQEKSLRSVIWEERGTAVMLIGKKEKIINKGRFLLFLLNGFLMKFLKRQQCHGTCGGN